MKISLGKLWTLEVAYAYFEALSLLDMLLFASDIKYLKYLKVLLSNCKASKIVVKYRRACKSILQVEKIDIKQDAVFLMCLYRDAQEFRK